MRRGSILLGVLFAAILAWLWGSGRLDEFANPERTAALLNDLGPFGPVLFIALIVALFPLFLIGPPIWASSAVWPPALAVIYSTLGCILASLLCYALARNLGQTWAQQRIPDKLRRHEERLVEHPIRAVFMLRVLVWANPAVDLLIGISRVTPRDYLVATILGLIPPTLFHVLLVGKGFQLALALPGWLWGASAGAAGAALAFRAIRRRRQAAAAPAPASAGEASDA
jgi:uncharacterized membrane protein YdjX (TVP38/TMEM64 family)